MASIHLTVTQRKPIEISLRNKTEAFPYTILKIDVDGIALHCCDQEADDIAKMIAQLEAIHRDMTGFAPDCVSPTTYTQKEGA